MASSSANLAIDALTEFYRGVIAGPPLTSAVAQQHLSDLDIKLISMRRSLAHLNQCRNALLPISILPEDIFMFIFELAAAMDPLIDQELSGRRFPLIMKERDASALNWMKITHVCTSWRRVALLDWRLWSHITFRLGPRWGDEFVRRSRMDLTVEYTHYDYASRDFIRVLRENFSLVKDVRLYWGRHNSFDLNEAEEDEGQEEYLGEEFRSILARPALRLRTLHLYAAHSVKRSHWPHVLFAGEAPMLRELYLRVNTAEYIGFEWQWQVVLWDIFPSLIPVMTCLTSLTVDFQCEDGSDTSRFQSLHGALSVAHNLVHLDIRGYLFALQDTLPTSFAHLSLPALQTYHVESGLECSIALLTLVDIPDTCSLLTGCYLQLQENASAYVSLLLERVRHRFASICTLEVASRKIPHERLELSGWQSASHLPLTEDLTESGDPEQPTRTVPNISVAFYGCPPSEMGSVLQHHRSTLADLFARLTNSGCLRQIHNLSFRIARNDNPLDHESPNWARVRENIPELKWLRVDGGIAVSFLNWQRDAVEASESSLLSSLSHLMVTGVHSYDDSWDKAFATVSLAQDRVDNVTSPDMFSVTVGSEHWYERWPLEGILIKNCFIVGEEKLPGVLYQ